MTSHIISPRIPCNIIVSTFLQAHISPTHLSSELRSFVTVKNIYRPNCKTLSFQYERRKLRDGNLLDMETMFSDFKIPEALTHYGMILQININ